MSKTDKTRPMWVKQDEYRILYPRRTEDIYSPDRYWIGEFQCGCGMCGWPSQSKALRAADKRAIREGLDDYYEE